jgi:hypothetical protein
MEDEENKIKAMTHAELVADAGIAYSQTIAEFFGDRCTNFSLLGEIASVKRKEMDWPMSYNQQTAFVHSCAASLEMMMFVADEVKKCCQVMQLILEDGINGEKAYNMLHKSMTESVDRINAELDRQIEFVQGLNDEDEE